MSNLLCIDWDFHFYNPFEAANTDDPNLRMYDWGHAESPIFLSNMIWETRASAFFQYDLPLPGVVVPDGGWAGFWDRFQFTEQTRFTFADSNAYAGTLTPPDGSPAFGEVVLFDAHHDSGYRIKTYGQYLKQDQFSCEDWMLEHQRHGTDRLTVRYPTWKPHGPTETLPKGAFTRQMLDDGAPVPTVFDTVFVCRSGAWVPSWCDSDFAEFIEAAPMDGTQMDDTDMDREFNPDTARALGEQMAQIMADIAADRT